MKYPTSDGNLTEILAKLPESRHLNTLSSHIGEILGIGRLKKTVAVVNDSEKNLRIPLKQTFHQENNENNEPLLIVIFPPSCLTGF